MVENLRKMQELRAQIQAQVKLAETLKKISENAGKYGNHGRFHKIVEYPKMPRKDIYNYIESPPSAFFTNRVKVALLSLIDDLC